MVKSHGGPLGVGIGALQVRAPKGAIRKGQTLTIRTVPKSRSARGTSSIAAGPYAISTSQGEPRKPVEVTFSYKPALLRRGDHALVLHDSTIAHGWVPVGGTIDPRANTISAKIGSFSLVDVVDDATYYASMRTAPPCQAAFPDARRKTIGRTTWYNRQESMRMVLCYRFGLNPSADFPISAGMVCGMLAEVIGHGIAEKLGLFTTGACSGAEIASDPGEPTKYISAVCGWASALLKSVPAALGCTFAPSAGTSLGSLFESKHELDVAVDVARRGKCIKYSPTYFGSPWLAVDCAPGDPGFSGLPLGSSGNGDSSGDGSGGGVGAGPGSGGGEEGSSNGGGTSWRAIDLPVPSAGTPGLGDVAGSICSPTGRCYLAGNYRVVGQNYYQSMIDAIGSGIVTASEAPVPSGGETGGNGSFFAPQSACSLNGTCMLTGFYQDGAGAHEMIETLIGGAWNSIELPVPEGGVVSSGDASSHWVSGTWLRRKPACSSNGTCVLSGEYEDEGDEWHEMIETLVGGTWRATKVPVPPGGVSGSSHWITEPHCTSTGACVMTGEYKDESGEMHDMLLTLSGGTWSAINPPLPANGAVTGGWELYGPSCSSNGTCVMSGSYHDTSGEWREMVETLVDGAWGAIEVPLPADAKAGSGDILAAPSCTSNGTCVVTGDYYREAGQFQPLEEEGMIATLSGNFWTATKAPVPLGSSRAATPFSRTPVCASSGTCALTGKYEDEDGEMREMIETLYGGTWNATEVPVPSDGITGSARSLEDLYVCAEGACTVTPENLVCSTNGTCVLTSEYESVGGKSQYMFATLVSGTWRATELPVPVGGVAGSGSIKEVPTCTSNGTCVLAGEYADEGGETRQMILTLAEGTWSAVEAPVPPDGVAGSGYPTEPACSSDGLCIMSGNYHASTGEPHEMVVIGER